MFGNRPRRSMNEQAMVGAMPETLAAPQMQTMPMPEMPQAAQPRRGGGLRNVAGVLGDMLSQAAGGQARFLPNMMQERDEQRQLQLRQQMQAEQRAYEESQWRQRQDYERANPEPRYFEDNAGNQWQDGPNGPQLRFRDPTPRFQFVQGVDAAGNTVMQQVPIPNNVPIAGGVTPPQAAPQAAPQTGLRPLPQREATRIRQALGEAGFQRYLQEQGFEVVPDNAPIINALPEIEAEMRHRGLL
jgi:hypothetical protein